MANNYYMPSGTPATRAAGSSAAIRNELAAIAAGFALLPNFATLNGNAVVVNGSGTALTTTGSLSLGAAFATTGGHGTTLIEQAATSLTLPAASDTLVGRATTDTLTNKTLTSPVINGTVSGTYTLGGSPTVTGGTFNSPTLVTPALGTPVSGVATNLTGTASGLTAGNVTTNANLTGPITSIGNATSVASQTGTGSKFVMDTSPTLVTPTLGVATATSINGLAITTSSGTLTITNGKTFDVTGSLTLSGTDGTTMTMPGTSATLARTDAANTFTGHQTIEGVTTTGATGTGNLVFSGTPTLTTPNIGAATATSVNGLAITSSTGTLTIANGKTHVVSNSITLAGTDATTMTFPTTTATLARTDAANTFTGHQTIEGVTSTGATGTGAFVFATSPTLVTPSLGAATATTINGVTIPTTTDTAALLGKADQLVTGGANITPTDLGTITTGTVTLDCGKCPGQKLVNNGAFTLAAPANDGMMILSVTNGASAGTITFSGFTVSASTGDALTTTNASVFFITIVRINGVSTYFIKALQ